jgi:hypothetical protein
MGAKITGSKAIQIEMPNSRERPRDTGEALPSLAEPRPAHQNPAIPAPAPVAAEPQLGHAVSPRPEAMSAARLTLASCWHA